jgi:hypothetical protein
MPFEETADIFKEISTTAEQLTVGVQTLEPEVRELAVQETRQVLHDELMSAINRTPEFQNPLLKERLVSYFLQPERVILQGNEIQINVDMGAGKDWINAQEVANELRDAGEETREFSQAQKAAYWKFKVYGTDDYEQTIQERFGALDDSEAAPYWYFLEFGTGPLAHPSSAGTFFIRRTGVRTKDVVNYWINKVADEFEKRAADGLSEGRVIGWTKWSQGKSGKWYSFAYDPRTGWRLGGFKARIRETM